MTKPTSPEVPLKDTLKKAALRSCIIAAISAAAGAVLLTVLLAAFPATREIAVPVPAKYAQTLTKGMVWSIAWKVLCFTGAVLLLAASWLRHCNVRNIEAEDSLHEADQSDREENRRAFRRAARVRKSDLFIYTGAVLFLLFLLLVRNALPALFLLLPVPFAVIFAHHRKKERNPMPYTPAAAVFDMTDRYSRRLTAAALTAALISGAVLLLCCMVSLLANRRRIQLNSTAQHIRKAIVYWQEQCEQEEMPCELPPASEEQHGSDADPDSLTSQIRQYYTDIDNIPYYRVLSENGTVTDVLISRWPITDTAPPDASEQCALLSSPFTGDLAVGSANAVDDSDR